MKFSSIFLSILLANILFTSSNYTSPKPKPQPQPQNQTKIQPKIYYVSSTGKDSNNGNTLKTPFKTIQKAANLTQPGDTVYILNGTYTNSSSKQVVNITRSGLPTAWIKYKAYPGHKPKIKHNAWNGIFIGNASYIEIEGLEVEGNNANITIDYALAQKDVKDNHLTSGNCISVDGRKAGDKKPHHIIIRNNKVHNCGGGGIAIIQADYITIHRNEVYNNAWYSVYANSGISLYQNWNYDDYVDGYKMLVTNNKVYNNRQNVPWILVGKITDGNGIIIDDSKNTQHNSKLGRYKGRTLVANNISYNNGGSGIHSFESENVDIINNTAYMNNQSPELNGGQIFASFSQNVRIINNIMYAYPGKNINSNFKNSNIFYDYNIYYNTNKIVVKGRNDIIANPEFVDPNKGNFKLKPTSPAIDQGTFWPSISYDYQYFSRIINTKQDIGAFEFRGEAQ